MLPGPTEPLIGGAELTYRRQGVTIDRLRFPHWPRCFCRLLPQGSYPQRIDRIGSRGTRLGADHDDRARRSLGAHDRGCDHAPQRGGLSTRSPGFDCTGLARRQGGILCKTPSLGECRRKTPIGSSADTEPRRPRALGGAVGAIPALTFTALTLTTLGGFGAKIVSAGQRPALLGIIIGCWVGVNWVTKAEAGDSVRGKEPVESRI